MNRRTILRGLSSAALLAAASPALAHHGTLIAYDRTKAWTRDATVTGFHFANPHPQLFFDLKNADGTVEHWAAELLPNPAALIRNGWTRVRSEQALKPGTPVTVTIAPPRAGGMVGLLMKITDMNGTELLKDDGLPPPPDNSLSAAPQPAKP
jgi:uncharacterized protein DUF6152